MQILHYFWPSFSAEEKEGIVTLVITHEHCKSWQLQTLKASELSCLQFIFSKVWILYWLTWRLWLDCRIADWVLFSAFIYASLLYFSMQRLIFCLIQYVPLTDVQIKYLWWYLQRIFPLMSASLSLPYLFGHTMGFISSNTSPAMYICL